ncbi:hypothetical protein V6N11_076902 [Hibiscus sabdariffa]|uniref:Uncharacterized protein n=1 Tax=Hibiscus sabdariffa TaxID=183260 RepID=A0ABR2TBG2_9ROSI
MENQTPNQMHSVVTNTMAMRGVKLPQKVSKNHVRSNSQGNVKQFHHVYYQPQQSGANMKGRELEDPATKSYMKAMAARALWHLAKGNSSICRSITESRAFLCFAVLLEKGTDDSNRNKDDCHILDEREAEVSKEVDIALTKFACTDNYLHLDHSKAIISAGGAKHLIQLVYFGEQIVQLSALVLLCYIAFHVPDSEELAQAKVLTVLGWASKQSYMTQDETIDTLLQEAKSRLELYQSRGSSGFH